MKRRRVLIIDDEPLARATLRDFLAGAEDFEIAGEAADGRSAVALIDAQRPDVIFLDIQMPVFSGLEVLARAAHHPHVVFTTAFDHYAVNAFELGAVDYLLKPFGRQRFGVMLDRLRAASAPGGHVRASEQLAGGALQRIYVRAGNTIRPVPVKDIERFEACGDYVAVHYGQARHLISVRLRDLPERLSPAQFVQIHRSHIVNLDFVASMAAHDGGRWRLILKSGTTLITSRSGAQALRSHTH